MNKRELDYMDIARAARAVASAIIGMHPEQKAILLYGVPRGGLHAAAAVQNALTERAVPCFLTTDVDEASYIIDDLIDSGRTCDHYRKLYPTKDFLALFHRNDFDDRWLVFPWERATDGKDEGMEDNVTRILQYIGEDPKRGGLLETPKRVAKAWAHWTSGYNVNIGALLKTFEDGGEDYDEMVIVKDIPIYSKCEHHLADIIGTATIAYIPNGKVVGLSKLSRVADAFARRLQVQERLTNQIADALQEHLDPVGVGVLIRARHMCMESRGICQQGHHTITSALRGALKEDAQARSEFLKLA